MPRALLCSFADLSALPHGGCFLFHFLRLWILWTSHDLLIWTTSIRLRTATSFLIPPFYITRPPTPRGTPNSRQQLPDDAELVVTASFLPLETGSSQVRCDLDLHVILARSRRGNPSGQAYHEREEPDSEERTSEVHSGAGCVTSSYLIPQRARVARHSKLLCSWYPTPVKWLSLAVSQWCHVFSSFPCPSASEW